MSIPQRIVQERPVIYRPTSSVGSVYKENVTYYARVSTQNDEQEDSYERQKAHFEEKIRSNPNWNYIEGYADWGISGTKAESRKEFMRMIEDCRAGKINRILVKSISRFGRNTVDTLKYIRELRELGISVYFETQNLDTLTAGGDILITILAAMAEQESRTMSTNIKWAFQKRFKDGRVLINYTNTLGYIKADGDEGYEIVESEAEIVRMVYKEYLSGKTMRQIADDLNDAGVKTKRGCIWQPSAIEGVLTNMKYTGNAILGMTYKPDVLSKSRLKNEGQSPSYYVENSHPAIVSQELFDMVQAEIQRRKSLRSTVQTGKGKYSSKYVLSGLLVCGECGGKLRRFGRNLKSGEFVPTWVCVTHQKTPDNCKMKPIKEADIFDAYARAVGRLVGDYRTIVQVVRETAEEELKRQQTSELTSIEDELMEKRKAVLQLFRQKRNGEIGPTEYESKYAEYSTRILELETAADNAKREELQKQLTQSRLARVYDLLDNIGTDYTEDGVMRAIIDCIKVEGKHDIEFQFKCGVNIHETL